ncbi:alkaline phosphatase [Heyndrickxia acidicola]|uniref:Alkaline phosphatase n=1 Tax=Heyndrickxia acidicola TaxID=209389 RepID=A0ABU6MH20_9BACI|nr:alkaline phosphatase [Heyndrickxia acidicola]MED1202948.1 alkaline phosphatase [Heyndrickxia acidicola]
MKTFFVIMLLFSTASAIKADTVPVKPRNVIFMVMDGTNSDSVTLSRWYKGSPLALDKILTGGVRTYSLQSSITDSAAAGTAMATGEKTIVDLIGMVPVLRNGKMLEAKPAANLLEAARQKGLATGVVSTSPVQHATPAAFSAHSINRGHFDDIAEQQVYQGVDVILGGGKESLLSKPETKNSRKDGENLVSSIKKQGYAFVETKEQLTKTIGPKVWGSFAQSDIAYELDRKKLYPSQPSLAEMTRKSIQLLSAKKKGFFLFIEGSKVDWAAHKNDPVGMISEILSFDTAVSEAISFASQDQNTLVIAVTDHGNSGLTMGNISTNQTYPVSPAETFVKPLKAAKLTVTGAASLLNHNRSNMKKAAEAYGLTHLTKEEWAELTKSPSAEESMAHLLSKRAHIGFTTNGHTGEDVFLYSYGPDKPHGLVNNTDLPKIISSFLSLPSLSDLSERLFVRADEFYGSKGYKTELNQTDPQNPVFRAEKKGSIIDYPINKNYLLQNGKKIRLIGVTVSNGNHVWISPMKPTP